MGSGSSTTTDQSKAENTAPWAAQAPYLKQAFKAAQDAYTKAQSGGPYTGDYVAAPNADQYAQNQSALNFANGAGQGAVGQQLNTGTTLTGLGTGATGSAISGLEGATSGDTLGRTISGANQVAAGFDIPGQVAASMRDANTEAANNTLPSLYRGAAATGNINSDRTALAEGVVKSGLANKAADLSASLRNSTYGTGLTTAQQDTAQKLSGNTALGSLGNTAAALGTGATSAGVANAGAVNQMGSGAADANQKLSQDVINNNLAKYQGNQAFDWGNLSNLMSVIGGKNWGSQGTSTSLGTVQNNPSLLQNLSSLFGLGGSLIKGT